MMCFDSLKLICFHFDEGRDAIFVQFPSLICY